jgi:type II secretory pathway component PulF
MTLTHTILPLLGFLFGELPDWVFDGLGRFLMMILSSGLWLAIIIAEFYLVHFLFSLPLRRTERARLFLDLLNDALQRGQPVEEMILSVARSGDLTVGVRFHILAAHIENGLRFGEALKKTPRYLPPQISAMLLAGERLGDLKKVLPAAREILRERPASVRSAVHYLILVILFFTPLYVGVMMMTMTFVVPKFKDVAAGMGIHLWPVSLFVLNTNSAGILIGAELFLTLLVIAMAILYIGGPGFTRHLQFRGFPIADWLAWRTPWKRKRLQRTFSALLAVLLDGGVPETEAVRLAGESTANAICRHRAARVIAAIESGIKLDEAVRRFDDSREFRWRLSNAVHARSGFLQALRGWHEALDARAFQQEEAAAHALTTGVVLLNGAFVMLIAIAMFGILMAVLNASAFAP